MCNGSQIIDLHLSENYHYVDSLDAIFYVILNLKI